MIKMPDDTKSILERIEQNDYYRAVRGQFPATTVGLAQAKRAAVDLRHADLEVIYERITKIEQRTVLAEEFISLCEIVITDDGQEVLFWRDSNYEYAKSLLKQLKTK